MNGKAERLDYDIAVIGAGPVGCVSALAFAERGARVLLLESNPRAVERLAGEWLHPPAVEILRGLGVDLKAGATYESGRGFVLYPDDGTNPIPLPYRAGNVGHAIEHVRLVERLRERAMGESLIDYQPGSRATNIVDQTLSYQQKGGGTRMVRAGLVVGASGRSGVAHAALSIDRSAATYSRMAGLLLEGVRMPLEGHGHVFLGGPGPALAYRIDDRHVRLCLDVPLSMRVQRSKAATLWEAFSRILPEALRGAFRKALESGEIAWATNQIRPRVDYGREGLALVGDAVGHHHPLTALGMTLGFQDAVALAEAKNFRAYSRGRTIQSRAPEMLAVALYEVFADTSDETAAIRSGIYDLWREQPAERMRTMGFLSCEDTNPLHFGGSFLKALLRASSAIVRDGVVRRDPRHAAEVAGELGMRLRWLMRATLHLTPAEPTRDFPRSAEDRYGAALKAAAGRAEVLEHPAAERATRLGKARLEPRTALARGVRALVAEQAEDGSWEGEVIWNPMLAAQYVMACHVMGLPIDPVRRERILLQFARTRLPDGTWGMHELSQPYLFVTTLVYVAARLLGVPAEDPLVAKGLGFIRKEGGAAAIPSWGKLWLALSGLYGWEGVPKVLPEAWLLPRSWALHPSKYYCHTRYIYLGMSLLVAARRSAPETAITRALRNELYPGGFGAVDFSAARRQRRAAELQTPPSLAVEFAYQAFEVVDRIRTPKSRAGLLAALREEVRYDLRASGHTALSPVSGLLGILALWMNDPKDPDAMLALERFEGWIWEDDTDGVRVAGARSATWDTSFAAQALVAASKHVDVSEALARADRFLEDQQIREVVGDAAAHDRLDPRGGYCFAGVWHGWPVSDCTAEAMLARLESPQARASAEDMAAAVRFVLRCQNPDGSFGSYEARRTMMPLEWLNPAEMFGDSMSEAAYAECTASCIAALAAFQKHYPELLRNEVDSAIRRAAASLRALQHADGSFPAAWGVCFIYGTMFGVRGLLAAGAPPHDHAIRKACTWIKARQRPDGGWGEHHESALRGQYRENDRSQVIQTAWALTALLEAKDPDWDAIDRGARFLAAAQRDDGTWPAEEPAGLFFRTALLHYTLYRSYFPIASLGLYETRKAEREAWGRERAAAFEPAFG
ncbi:prenyltransferase/squalene oxidase repeat-containing protein [Polyangium sp. 15x6]|uniref:FAD-dependent monooxygenase n=1 Tax=Polyangium sp. 15x6 TaxID=3042687 RepID=UPI00249C7801|nr:prenyltransferase/squalene oxidase repeat-containing protein [Polyangium sp. 15x6]MDI3284408.1 prenyltransferase/squalene oxidase repeat-containing protein [Polyangium sp. 15x6]